MQTKSSRNTTAACNIRVKYKFLALTVISKKYIHKPMNIQLNYVNVRETKTLSVLLHGCGKFTLRLHHTEQNVTQAISHVKIHTHQTQSHLIATVMNRSEIKAQKYCDTRHIFQYCTLLGAMKPIFQILSKIISVEVLQVCTCRLTSRVSKLTLPTRSHGSLISIIILRTAQIQILACCSFAMLRTSTCPQHCHCSQQVTQSQSFDCSHNKSETEHHGLKTAGTSNFASIIH
jgi:hypothetical protein